MLTDTTHPSPGHSLERRRLAVAQALRQAMTEPTAVELAGRLRDVEHEVAAVRLQLADAMARLDSGDEATQPAVKPLMTPTAAAALFGN